MNVSKKMTVGVAVAAVMLAILAGLLLMSKRPETDPQHPDASASQGRVRATETAAGKGTGGPDGAGTAASQPQTQPRKIREAKAPGAESAKRQMDAAAEEISEERLKVIEAWEDFVDKVAEFEGAPTRERALQLRREFDKLDKADQLDGIQTSLNLLPDEQFPLLYPILFDKTVDPDVLDAIFSDGLNHDEEIKIPMMKEIYKDKTHPMYEEAERILDATGELDNDEPDGGE